MHIPPSSAIGSTLAAMFTLSPYMSPFSSMTSPTWMPILSDRRGDDSSAVELTSATFDWIARAHSKALVEESKVARKASPIVFTSLPPYAESDDLTSFLCFSSRLIARDSLCWDNKVYPTISVNIIATILRRLASKPCKHLKRGYL